MREYLLWSDEEKRRITGIDRLTMKFTLPELSDYYGVADFRAYTWY